MSPYKVRKVRTLYDCIYEPLHVCLDSEWTDAGVAHDALCRSPSLCTRAWGGAGSPQVSSTHPSTGFLLDGSVSAHLLYPYLLVSLIFGGWPGSLLGGVLGSGPARGADTQGLPGQLGFCAGTETLS